MFLTIATNYVRIKYPEYDVIDIADQMNRSDLLFFLIIVCRGEGIFVLDKKEDVNS